MRRTPGAPSCGGCASQSVPMCGPARVARGAAAPACVGGVRAGRSCVVDAMPAARRRADARAAAGRSSGSSRRTCRSFHCTCDALADPAGRRAVVRAPRPRRSRRDAPCARRSGSSETARAGSGRSAGCSSANIAATWRFVVPWMRVSAQRVSQRSRYACASSSVSKRRPLSGVFCAWPTPASTLPFAIGIADAARQRDDAVVREHVAIERIERRVVDVRREHALAQIVEDDDARRAAEPAKRALVQLGPDLRARPPREQPHRLARVAERQDEEPRAPVLARRRVAHHRPVAVVDLAFLARRGRDDDARLGRRASPRSCATKRRTLAYRAVKPWSSTRSCQIAIALRPAAERLGDQLAVRLAGARARRAARPAASGGRTSAGRRRSRWTPRWPVLTAPGSVDTSAEWPVLAAAPRPPAAAAHRRSRRPSGSALAVSRRTPGRLLDAPQRPAQPPERQNLLLLRRRSRRCSSRRGTTRPRPRQRLGALLVVAGFQVSINGRFWVSTEVGRFVNSVINAANSGVSSSKAFHTDRAPLDRLAVMPRVVSVRYELALTSAEHRG